MDHLHTYHDPHHLPQTSSPDEDYSSYLMPPMSHFTMPMDDYAPRHDFADNANNAPEQTGHAGSRPVLSGFNNAGEYDDARSLFGGASGSFNFQQPAMSQSRTMLYGYGPQYGSHQPTTTGPQQQQQQQQPQHQSQSQAQHQSQQHTHHHTFSQSYPASFGPQLHPASVGFGPHSHTPMTSSVTMPATTADPGVIPYSAPMEQYGPLNVYQTDLQNGLVDFPMAHGRRFQHPAFGPANVLSTSPTDGASSSTSDSSWQFIDHLDTLPRNSLDSFENTHGSSTVSNPSLSLHIRSDSDSSHAKNSGSAHSVHSFGSFEDVQFPMQSPQSEPSDAALTQQISHGSIHHPQDAEYAYLHSGSHVMYPCSSPSSSSPSPVSPGSGSPLARRKKEHLNKVAKQTAQKKPVVTAKGAKKASPSDKKGRRQGPLTANKRQHASLVRKVGACLRCKFLKKTCGEGDPCHGCQPSHARLWQVPCTRLDIKDLGFFIGKWDADYRRHVSLEISDANIKGYSPVENVMWITHGYGIVFPVRVRQVFVRDQSCFNVDWVETSHETPQEFDVETAHLTVGSDGVDSKAISEYLDQYIDYRFYERFIDEHFQGTKFLTEMLKTAYAYFHRTQDPMIRKALKLILAYNLTQHITLVAGPTEDSKSSGKIEDEGSKFFGKTVAPNLINFQVKYVLAMTWRQLQDEVLKELSVLYTSVYSGEKLKNWPTIFMLASILLAVWEEMQFDAHYRMGEGEAAKKFCKEMETTPVGVIVGLFSAISQKLPPFKDWDSRKHHQLLNSNENVCEAMSEMRSHVVKHGMPPSCTSKVDHADPVAEDYLKTRGNCKYDREDFDSLSNKFLSKLVIRAN